MNCKVCGTRLGILERWRYGDFCSQEHKSVFDQDLESLDRQLGAEPGATPDGPANSTAARPSAARSTPTVAVPKRAAAAKDNPPGAARELEVEPEPPMASFVQQEDPAPLRQRSSAEEKPKPAVEKTEKASDLWRLLAKLAEQDTIPASSRPSTWAQERPTIAITTPQEHIQGPGGFYMQGGYPAVAPPPQILMRGNGMPYCGLTGAPDNFWGTSFAVTMPYRPAQPSHWVDQQGWHWISDSASHYSPSVEQVLSIYPMAAPWAQWPMVAPSSMPGGAMPGGAMFGGAMPGGAGPGAAMPGGAMPGGAMPGGAMPGSSMPGGQMPGGAMSSASMPGSAMPGGAIIGGVMPGGAGPGGAMPGGAMPGGAMFGGAMAGGGMRGSGMPGSGAGGGITSGLIPMAAVPGGALLAGMRTGSTMSAPPGAAGAGPQAGGPVAAYGAQTPGLPGALSPGVPGSDEARTPAGASPENAGEPIRPHMPPPGVAGGLFGGGGVVGWGIPQFGGQGVMTQGGPSYLWHELPPPFFSALVDLSFGVIPMGKQGEGEIAILDVKPAELTVCEPEIAQRKQSLKTELLNCGLLTLQPTALERPAAPAAVHTAGPEWAAMPALPPPSSALPRPRVPRRVAPPVILPLGNRLGLPKPAEPLMATGTGILTARGA